MILSFNVQEWIAVIGVACTLLSVVIIPLFKTIKKKRYKYLSTINKVQDISIQTNKTLKTIENINDNISGMKNEILDINEKINDMKKTTSEFEVQQLKYMINDAFYSFNSIEDIPDEVLINASQCCDIYIGKGLNHETGARCKLIYEELERRQEKLAHHKEGGKYE